MRDWRVLGTEGALAGAFWVSGSSSEQGSGVGVMGGDMGSGMGESGRGALSNQ